MRSIVSDTCTWLLWLQEMVDFCEFLSEWIKTSKINKNVRIGEKEIRMEMDWCIWKGNFISYLWVYVHNKKLLMGYISNFFFICLLIFLKRLSIFSYVLLTYTVKYKKIQSKLFRFFFYILIYLCDKLLLSSDWRRKHRLICNKRNTHHEKEEALLKTMTVL